MEASPRILTAEAATARLKRMAYEVWEAHVDNGELFVVGIQHRGARVAEALVNTLRAISDLTVHLHELPKHDLEAVVELPAAAHVLLVDDVLYSGRTLYEALVAVMRERPERVQVAVLIDRGHRQFPIHADYVGLDLATTLQAYVAVQYTKGTGFEAHLSG